MAAAEPEWGRLTNRYQPGRPYQNHHAFDMCGALPNPTAIRARGAKPIGAFGLVYHSLPIDRSGSTAILKCYYQRLPAAVLNTHTMITGIILYSLIVGLLAYAAYLKADMDRYK